jgi:hypothetical protein
MAHVAKDCRVPSAQVSGVPADRLVLPRVDESRYVRAHFVHTMDQVGDPPSGRAFPVRTAGLVTISGTYLVSFRRVPDP